MKPLSKRDRKAESSVARAKARRLREAEAAQVAEWRRQSEELAPRRRPEPPRPRRRPNWALLAALATIAASPQEH